MCLKLGATETCPLCKRERLTQLLYEDEVCWATYCSSHPSKVLIVLKRHVPTPNPEEIAHMKRVIEKLFMDKEWRYGGVSIRDHYHIHEV